MRIFKTKVFNKWAKGLLSDKSLLAAVDEIATGNFDASLGQKIFKQRVAEGNTGKSGSMRTIVAFHEGDNVFFMYGFSKSARANISATEMRALQKAAKVYFALSGKNLTDEIKAKRLVEIIQKTKI